jgi:hypothetical protein
VPGGQQHEIKAMHDPALSKRENMLDASARQAALHQARSALGDDDLFVRRNVIAVRVRNEGETLCIPWIQPQILLRQVNPAFITNFNHKKILLLDWGRFHLAG